MSNAESIQLQRTPQILLLVANKAVNSKGILTGKFFEYLGIKHPILAIGQADSDLEKIVKENTSGCFVDYDDVGTVIHFIENSFEKFQRKQLYSRSLIHTEQFHSKTMTKKYLNLIERL